MGLEALSILQRYGSTWTVKKILLFILWMDQGILPKYEKGKFSSGTTVGLVEQVVYVFYEIYWKNLVKKIAAASSLQRY